MEKIPLKISLNVNVKRYTTDSNGTILPDASIPQSEKKPFPFHTFGKFDMNGGYNIADSIVSEVYDTKLFGVYVWGVGTPLFFFSPFATINSAMRKGDLVFIYVDDFDSPNYFTFVIAQAQTGSFASIISQTESKTVFVQNVKYTWQNDLQLSQNLYVIKTKSNNAFGVDTISPAAYYVPEQKSVQTTLIPLRLDINRFVGISSFLEYQNPLLNLSFELYA